MLRRSRILLPITCFAALLYGFFLGLDLMGLGFKLFGEGFAEMLLEQTANPLVGLFAGILATSLVQSSSTTTSMTVALVAAGGLTIEGAIPIIMGANIGTSATKEVDLDRMDDAPSAKTIARWHARSWSRTANSRLN